jgi:tetratricopeptide (TPR) repeat protein
MPHCWKCGAEVDGDQKICAWCGEEQKNVSQPASPPQRPKNIQPPPPEEGIEEARKAAQAGHLDKATQIFQSMLNADSNDQGALFGLGGVHFKRNDYRKAVECWLKLKIINPDYPNLENWIAQAQSKFKSLTPVPKTGPPTTSMHDLPTKRTTPPSKPAGFYGPPSKGKEDWQSGIVRIKETEIEKKLTAHQPSPQLVVHTVEPDLKTLDTVNPVPFWLPLLGWISLVIMSILVVLLYR